jgi:hypothetical protein
MNNVQDVGWGTVNQAVFDHADRLRRDSRAKPSYFIKAAAGIHPGPAPADVARLLHQTGVVFALVGSHARSVYTKEPRASRFVEVIVDDVVRATDALGSLISRTWVFDPGPDINIREITVHGGALVKVHAASDNAVGAILQHRRRITIDGQRAWIPTLPATIALTWHSMHSSGRDPIDRLRDTADFLDIITMNPDADIDAAAKLVALASTLLARQLIYDMKNYRKTGDIHLFGGPA